MNAKKLSSSRFGVRALLSLWTARGRLTQCSRGLKHNSLLRRFTSPSKPAFVESQLSECSYSRTINQSLTQLSMARGSRQSLAGYTECDERDRCNAGRVLTDHRVRIARQIVTLSTGAARRRAPEKRDSLTIKFWFVRSRRDSYQTRRLPTKRARSSLV